MIYVWQINSGNSGSLISGRERASATEALNQVRYLVSSNQILKIGIHNFLGCCLAICVTA